MAEIGRWSGHKFEVSSTLLRGFTGLSIKGSNETEDMDSGGQGYVSRKKGKPTEVSLTVGLNALTGCDVYSEAIQFVSEARDGQKDYFYVSNKKLVTCQLMLTEASVQEVEIASNGKWMRANVRLTMKQCSKNDGSSGGGSSTNNNSISSINRWPTSHVGSSSDGGGTWVGGSSSSGSAKKSVKKQNVTQKQSSTSTKKADSTSSKNDSTKSNTSSTKTGVSLATAYGYVVGAISNAISNAKKTSATTKSVSKGKAGGGGTSSKIMMIAY